MAAKVGSKVANMARELGVGAAEMAQVARDGIQAAGRHVQQVGTAGIAAAPEIFSNTCKNIQDGGLKANISEKLGEFGTHVRENPGTFALQAVGGTVAVAAVATVPILGAAGFAATGPVAGSAAAAWQASIGLVEAGSIFAFCQSVTMGGAAVGGLVAAGATGAGVAGAATVGQVLGIKDRFRALFGKSVNGSESGVPGKASEQAKVYESGCPADVSETANVDRGEMPDSISERRNVLG